MDNLIHGEDIQSRDKKIGKFFLGLIAGFIVSLIILQMALYSTESFLLALLISILIILKSYKAKSFFYMGIGFGLFAYIVFVVVLVLRSGWWSP